MPSRRQAETSLTPSVSPRGGCLCKGHPVAVLSTRQGGLPLRYLSAGDAEAHLFDLDVKLELCQASLADLQSEVESHSKRIKGRTGADAKSIAELPAPDARAVVTLLVEDLVKERARVWKLQEDLQKADNTGTGLRMEHEKLQRRFGSVGKSFRVAFWRLTGASPGRLSEVGRSFEERINQLQCQHQRDLVVLAKLAGDGASADSRTPEDEDQGDEAAKRQITALLMQNEEAERRYQVRGSFQSITSHEVGLADSALVVNRMSGGRWRRWRRRLNGCERRQTELGPRHGIWRSV
jgi:hypothetical protein